jgi:FdhD protein
VLSWPDQLRTAQAAFDATGGLHAAGLVDLESNELLVAREDIGRHNAVDKVIGWALLGGRVPLGDCGLVVSGRTSFEIVQKALRAGVPVVAAVSAASGLAARLADEEGLTLLGFVRGGRSTIYSHPERLAVSGGPPGG